MDLRSILSAALRRGASGHRIFSRRFARSVAERVAVRLGLSSPAEKFRYLLQLTEVELARGVAAPDCAALRLEWIVPPFDAGSGGHSTIFRLTAELARRGHRNRFWFTPGNRFASPKETHAAMQRWFTPQTCEVEFILPESIDRIVGDVCIATEHTTAYYAAAVRNVQARCYLVQDFEPFFFPHGSAYLVAEQTYRLALEPITCSRWLSSMLQPYYGYVAPRFELAIDPSCYRRLQGVNRSARPSVAFYLRDVTPRRCAELGVLALELLAERLPDLEVHFFGQPRLEFERKAFRAVHHGVVSPAKLAQLYNEVRVGVVFSATNHSLIPAEMMACGLPVLELDSPSITMDFPAGSLVRALPHPRAMADAMARLLSDQDAWERQQQHGLAFAAGLKWTTSAAQLNDIIVEKVRSKLVPH